MKIPVIFVAMLATAFLLTQCAPEQAPGPASDPGPIDVSNSPEEHVKRGEYLVSIMGCNDCHSPKIMTEHGPAPDPNRLLSGHPADEKLALIADKKILKDYALFNMSLTATVGPWGSSFAANLTPDETGLGEWTLEQFGKAVRQGKSKGMDDGRMLLPPMPWQNFTILSDQDLADIWAYLQAIPPVENVVAAPVPPAG